MTVHKIEILVDVDDTQDPDYLSWVAKGAAEGIHETDGQHVTVLQWKVTTPGADTEAVAHARRFLDAIRREPAVLFADPLNRNIRTARTPTRREYVTFRASDLGALIHEASTTTQEPTP